MILIPARIGSSRFPDKILADIFGLPMVIRTAKAVEKIDRVVIATDSQDVVKLAMKHKIEAVLTETTHQSGTDRIFEAASKLLLEDDEIILNVQADEPFIEPEVVAEIYALTKRYRKDENVLMCSCYKTVTAPFADDTNIVKTVLDEDGFALYFSRSKIPFPRDHSFDSYKGHLGIYGYTMRGLRRFCSLPPSPLEKIEKLEQLRALSYGYRIAMKEVQTKSFGIDTPEDLERALEVFGPLKGFNP